MLAKNNMAPEMEPINIELGRKQRKMILVFVVFFFFAYGFIDSQTSTYPNAANVIDGAIIPLLISSAIFWCAIEKRLKGEGLGFWWVFGMFLAAPVLLPVFFFNERGLNGGLIFTAKFIVLNALVVLIAAIGSMAAKYIVTT
jgi:hypothetical protein